MDMYTIVRNGHFTHVMTAEAAYCNFGINVHRANSAGIIRDRFTEYKITKN